MNLYPHDHRMWAVIGVYGGQEENVFYRRSETGLTGHGNKTLVTKDTLPLGESVIHAVTNPLEKIAAAIHVYGGDFFAVPRSEWDLQTLKERPFDLENAEASLRESTSAFVHPGCPTSSKLAAGSRIAKRFYSSIQLECYLSLSYPPC